MGHPRGEANEINQPLPIRHSDHLKNKKDTETAVIHNPQDASAGTTSQSPVGSL